MSGSAQPSSTIRDQGGAMQCHGRLWIERPLSLWEASLSIFLEGYHLGNDIVNSSVNRTVLVQAIYSRANWVLIARCQVRFRLSLSVLTRELLVHFLDIPPTDWRTISVCRSLGYLICRLRHQASSFNICRGESDVWGRRSGFLHI